MFRGFGNLSIESVSDSLESMKVLVLLTVLFFPTFEHRVHVANKLLKRAVIPLFQLLLDHVNIHGIRIKVPNAATLASRLPQRRKDVAFVVVFNLLEGVPAEIQPFWRLRRFRFAQKVVTGNQHLTIQRVHVLV